MKISCSDINLGKRHRFSDVLKDRNQRNRNLEPGRSGEMYAFVILLYHAH